MLSKLEILNSLPVCVCAEILDQEIKDFDTEMVMSFEYPPKNKFRQRIIVAVQPN